MEVFGGGITVSDSTGKLLFYTDGNTIWNNKHWIIGQGIHSNIATNSIRIRQNKGDIFHLFSLHHLNKKNSYQLYSSVLDLSVNGGKGKLINKNQLVQSGFTSGITTVPHANGKEMWVIVHDTINTFYAFLHNQQGFQPIPVKSTVGKPVPTLKQTINTRYLATLRASPQGDKIAMLYFSESFDNVNELTLFHFDPSNGKFSHPKRLRGEKKIQIQDMEFSPSGQKIYASAAGAESKYNADILYQFDLLNSNTSTRRTVINKPKTVSHIRGLQLAKNGKIYVAQPNHPYLGVINYPEKTGKLCDYTPEGIHLKGRDSRVGLPAFPAHYFRPNKQIVVGKPFVRNIEFASAQATIQSKYYKLLDDIALFLKKHPKNHISITGHTDNVGFAKSNLILSRRRAQAVANYLAKKGIEKERISTKGEGQTTPIASNTNAIGRKKNRRIEFFIK
jgi:outer membrane protein OmpA-like peptidoglycan-associated protein